MRIHAGESMGVSFFLQNTYDTKKLTQNCSSQSPYFSWKTYHGFFITLCLSSVAIRQRVWAVASLFQLLWNIWSLLLADTCHLKRLIGQQMSLTSPGVSDWCDSLTSVLAILRQVWLPGVSGRADFVFLDTRLPDNRDRLGLLSCHWSQVIRIYWKKDMVIGCP